MKLAKEKCHLCPQVNKSETHFVRVKIEEGDKLIDARVCPDCWKQLWNTMLKQEKAQIK